MEKCVIVLVCFVQYLFASSCDFNVKVKQGLENQGFHRNITYEVVFNKDEKHQADFYKHCILGIDQTLPAGIYVNPNELSDLRRVLRVHAIPKNHVNVELPTELSYPSSVYTIGRIMGRRVKIWLPVHARYHKAVAGGGIRFDPRIDSEAYDPLRFKKIDSKGKIVHPYSKFMEGNKPTVGLGTATNVIDRPRLYLRCPDRRLDQCEKQKSTSVIMLCNGGTKEKCSWLEIPHVMVTEKLIWEVPLGNLDHYYIVAIGTSLAVAVGSLYLLKAIHEQAIAAKT